MGTDHEARFKNDLAKINEDEDMNDSARTYKALFL
jgi:hypothetical protein